MINLGIIGLSEGNGHPYSWSAIFNGYNKKHMDDCPFPVIPEYLYRQQYPGDFLSKAKVTHIWTQDNEISKQIAKASNIETIVKDYLDMIGNVDGILLARDDPEKHKQFAIPFIEAGLPIYIDKPIATNIKQLDYFKNIEKYTNQIFTCSALRYAKEFVLSEEDFEDIGEIEYIDAYTMKSWEKYAIHLIDPVIKNFLYAQSIENIQTVKILGKTSVSVQWDNGIISRFNAFEQTKTPIKIDIYGSIGSKSIIFKDTFYAFKSALNVFIEICFEKKENQYSFDYLRKIVEIISEGMS